MRAPRNRLNSRSAINAPHLNKPAAAQIPIFFLIRMRLRVYWVLVSLAPRKPHRQRSAGFFIFRRIIKSFRINGCSQSVSVDSKAFTGNLSPLDATLTKKGGEGPRLAECCIPFQSSALECGSLAAAFLSASKPPHLPRPPCSPQRMSRISALLVRPPQTAPLPTADQAPPGSFSRQ